MTYQAFYLIPITNTRHATRILRGIVSLLTTARHDNAIQQTRSLDRPQTCCSFAQRAGEPTHTRIAPQTAVWAQHRPDNPCLALCTETRLAHALKPRLPRRGAESTRTCQTPAAPSARRERSSERSRPSSPVMPGSEHAVRGVQELWHRCGGIDAGTCSTPAVAEPHAASPPS